MVKNEDDIKDKMSDNEIRILGNGNIMRCMEENSCQDGSGKEEKTSVQSSKNSSQGKQRFVFFAIFVVALCCMIGLIWHLYEGRAVNNTNDDPISLEQTIPADTLSIESITEEPAVDEAYTTIQDTTVNDIPLIIYNPTGGRMDLWLGKSPEKDKSIILAAHAADIRADVDLPAGAFVYKGELISKGHSKYGFCAIIDSVISIGRQRETPLLERVIEQNGSFFRQYSLVSNGILVSVPPKGKFIRRALCLMNGKFLIVETETNESYHDFSQALVDIGVTEALSLVGGYNPVVGRDRDGKIITENAGVQGSTYENFIVWRK